MHLVIQYFFKIENLAARVSKENIDELPDRFFALLRTDGHPPFLGFIEKENIGYKYLKNNKKHFVDKEDFLSIWQNVVLLVDKNEDIIDSKPKPDWTWLFIPLLFTLIAPSIIFNKAAGFVSSILLIFSLLGCYFSYEVIKQVFGVISTFASAVCVSRATTKSGSGTVINSKKTTLLPNFEFSDLSVIFLSGHLISFYLISITGNFQHLLNYSLITMAIGVPFILYSVYYQWRIAKNLCYICLLIIAVFSCEMAIFLVYGFFNTIHLKCSRFLYFFRVSLSLDYAGC